MRSSLRLVGVLALAFGALACGKKKEEASGPAEAPTAGGASDPAAPPTGEAGKPRRRALPGMARPVGFPRLALVPLAVTDVAGLWPQVPGAKPLAEPSAQAGGRQVRQAWCLSGADLTAMGADVQKAIAARGFTAGQPQPRGLAGRPRVVITAHKDDLRLSGSLSASNDAGCPGKAEVLFTFHKVVKRPPNEAGAPADGAAPKPATPPQAPADPNAAPARGE